MQRYILIIDDEPRNIFALVAVLKSKGYRCLTANGAAEGLKILQTREDIGIILMDMMMPDMDGYEAMSWIRNEKSLADVPIIAVTAQAMVGDREKCLNAGANAYISKPIDVDALEDLLKRFLRIYDN
ncbi:response regulator [Pararcticibacter amylolyticus]|uniref:Response regulator n=1 Tax=Pararcticibacter amylolyticus TaxID=2173175 RepID=A0A2U2PLM5_9SPHI|nr:response regulator [Pararcticibacter amylolyticus]PWG82228.1 response regulator [Pararcticibacter amylolyticus]